MKIGISTIAFQGKSFQEIIKEIQSLSLSGIEIAPGMLWEEPLASSKNDRAEVRKNIFDHGLTAIGLQAIMYKQPSLKIFDSISLRNKCADHIKAMLELSSDLGGSLCVLRGVSFRDRQEMSYAEAFKIAVDFFRKISQTAADCNVFLCIEPLSTKYNCEFINNADQGAQLVEEVNNPHFRLHLDSGSMILEGESPQEMIIKHAKHLQHMHCNDPHLSPPGSKDVDHAKIKESLKQIQYNHWITFEFKSASQNIKEELTYAYKVYC